MAKKTKRYEDGGEIVVTGSRPGANPNPMGAIPVSYALPPRNVSQRLSPISAPSGGSSGVNLGGVSTAAGKMYGLRGIPVGPGSLSVGATPRRGGGVGGTFSVPFKKGGEAKAKPKKMAKGGSTASKRADGCATKGKTKGRFV